MSIEAGTKLGPYEILAPLGAGGMGEVYRAKDTRLDRIVAIKVLPSHLSNNTEVRQRFEREARAVSSLNHPHICTLHDIGHQAGIDFLVMEFIDGETLSLRLKKGPLSEPELFRYSIQIADALDRAHRSGITHRDLKPGNIILTKSGAKLLDFGLAKFRSESKISPEVSSLPTEHRELTQEGMVLGTFQYMAPEQLEGKEVDARTDIFSFGAVMYEMATGKKAFEGNSQASLIAAILKEDPKPISQVKPLTPPILERLVKTCLAKDPEDRWQSAHDISNELRWISESSGTSQIALPADLKQKSILNSGRMGWIAAGLLLLVSIAGLLFVLPRIKQQDRIPIETHFSIAPGDITDTVLVARADFAISPDGTKIVYVAGNFVTGKIQLWLRPLKSLEALPVQGTDGARLPFWSPDGQYVAFSVGQRLMKIPFSGGAPQIICDLNGEFAGGAWLPDGTIIFGSERSGLNRVSAEGGEPKPLTQINSSLKEATHSWPVLLPDNKHFLYLSDSNVPESRAIYMGSLDSKEVQKVVTTPFKGTYINPGYLLFIKGASLIAQRFEINPPLLTGDPVRIVDQLPLNAIIGVAPFSSSNNGVIAYRSGRVSYKTQLTWFDRSGKLLSTIGPVGSDVGVEFSPDDKRAAVTTVSEIQRSVGRAEIPVNVWVIDLARGVRTRVTFDPVVSDENPVWSPDGRFLTFASHREGLRAQVFRKASSGEGQAVEVLKSDANEHPIDISPDGKVVLMHSDGGTARMNLTFLSLGESKSQTFLATEFEESQAKFSPDGRWVAFTSTESGREEVYVKPFPSGEGRVQISSSGGAEPRWRADGKELFYVSLDGSMMAVQINSGESFDFSPAVPLFKTGLPPVDLNYYGGSPRYDVTSDGSRFLITAMASPPQQPILNVIVNWQPPKK